MDYQEAESSHRNLKIMKSCSVSGHEPVLTQNSLTERGRTLHTMESASVNDFPTASPKSLTWATKHWEMENTQYFEDYWAQFPS